MGNAVQFGLISVSAIGAGDQPDRPGVYLAIMIGPDMCGKTTFVRMASKHFSNTSSDLIAVPLFYDSYSFNQFIYHLKNYAIKSISEHHEHKRRIIILVDAKNLHLAINRFNIFQFCFQFNIIYLKIYMEFDPQEVIIRCANRGLIVQPESLQNPEFFNRTGLFDGTNTKWQSNSITIFRSFRRHSFPEYKRLYSFLERCVPPANKQFNNNAISKVSLEYDNPHKLLMQAGISYKDTLLHGTPHIVEEKKDEKYSL